MDPCRLAPTANYLGLRFGNYRLAKLLGQGGFAEIYLGKHEYLDTQAAIKILRKQLTEEEVSRFLSEARISASLIHPHIVRVLDFGLEDAIPFIVMDYAPHGTLRQRHPVGTPLSLRTVLTYVRQIANALQYMHDRGLIHQDIKPENLLLGQNNQVLLSDFGITVAAHKTNSQSQKAGVGTALYMAPEQLRGSPSFASDQYALGIVIYEWLCGDVPFSGSAREVVVQHVIAPPPSLREKVPTISRAVEDVVLKALAKEPQQRFGSVQEFALALENAYRHAIERPRPVRRHTESLMDLPRTPPAISRSRQRTTHVRLPRTQPVAPRSRRIITRVRGAQTNPPVKARRRKLPGIWKEGITTFAMSILIGCMVCTVLYLLDLNMQAFWFLLLLSMLSLPLVGMFSTGNRRAFALVCCLFIVSAGWGIALHSLMLLIAAYVGLLLLSMAVAFILKFCSN